MRTILASLVLIVFTTAMAVAQDGPQEYRANLVRLSVAPSEFGGETVRVFCPIEAADVDGVYCMVLNSIGQTVGREYITAEPENAAAFIEILDRCSGPLGRPVGDDCAYLVDVFVEVSSGYAYPKAVSFQRIPE